MRKTFHSYINTLCSFFTSEIESIVSNVFAFHTHLNISQLQVSSPGTINNQFAGVMGGCAFLFGGNSTINEQQKGAGERLSGRGLLLSAKGHLSGADDSVHVWNLCLAAFCPFSFEFA